MINKIIFASFIEPIKMLEDPTPMSVYDSRRENNKRLVVTYDAAGITLMRVSEEVAKGTRVPAAVTFVPWHNISYVAGKE